jgi:hypothetical protein
MSRTSKRKARRKRPKSSYALTPSTAATDPARLTHDGRVLGTLVALPEHKAVWGPSPLTSFRRLWEFLEAMLPTHEPAFLITPETQRRETPMTEYDWLTTEDPLRMLDFMEGGALRGLPVEEMTDRQRDFIACAWWRHIKPHGKGHEERVRNAEDGRWVGAEALLKECLGRAHDLMSDGVFRRAGCEIIRDVVGNPFKPYTPPKCEGCGGTTEWWGEKHERGFCSPCDGTTDTPVLKWRTPTVLSLIVAAYDDRNALGELDPFRLGLIADALEDAGCSDAYVLGHLRGVEEMVRLKCQGCGGKGYLTNPGNDWDEASCIDCDEKGFVLVKVKHAPHVRGCHVLEALLGQS